MVRPQKANLAAVKKILTSFALRGAGQPVSELEAEFGDLLLFIIHLADKEGIDLIRAGQRQVERRAKSMPRAVRGGKA